MTQPPRRRGRPARITRESVLAAARELGPERLTMRAVADRLGVDPTAVNYHVADRETLRALVATELVAEHLERVRIPDAAAWDEALRIFASAIREALIATGHPNPVLRLAAEDAPGAFALVEAVFARLVGAGLTSKEAVSTITAVNMLAFAAAREAVVSAGAEHPQRMVLREALAAAPDAAAVREILAGWDPASTAQFEFALGLLIDGVAARGCRPAPGAGRGRRRGPG